MRTVAQDMSCRVLCVVSCLLAAPAAHAIPITYHYDGGNFTTLEPGVPATVTGITASFTVDLLPNSIQIDVPLSNWVVSDGNNTIDEFDSDYEMYSNVAITDAAAAIIGFRMEVRWFPFFTPAHPVPVGENYAQFFSFGTYGYLQQSWYCAGSNTDGTCSFGRAGFGENSDTATLQPVQVLEPGTLSLLGAALMGFVLLRLRRKKPIRIAARVQATHLSGLRQ